MCSLCLSVISRLLLLFEFCKASVVRINRESVRTQMLRLFEGKRSYGAYRGGGNQ